MPGAGCAGDGDGDGREAAEVFDATSACSVRPYVRGKVRVRARAVAGGESGIGCFI